MSGFSFNKDSREKFEFLLTRYPQKKAALLPTLWLVHYQEGWISKEAMEYVAKELEITPIEVYEFVTFCTMFSLKPEGKYVIEICRTLSCQLRGAKTLLEYLQEKLGIGIGETTEDGLFTLKTVECLGSCGTAPAMRLNGEYYENLTTQKLDEILKECR